MVKKFLRSCNFSGSGAFGCDQGGRGWRLEQEGTPLGAGVMPTYYEAMYAGFEAGPEEDKGMLMGGNGAGVPNTQETPQSSEPPQSAMGSGRGRGKGRGDGSQLGGSHRASNVERYDMRSDNSSGWSSSQDPDSEDWWAIGS